MDRLDIIIFAAAFAFLAVRLYQKYIKKNRTADSAQPNKKIIGKKNDLAGQSDDYEPYSKK
jgi:hypothetical protein